MHRFPRARRWAIISLVIATAACVTNKETGRRSLILVPRSTMQTMGLQAYREVLAKEQVSNDARLNAIVRRVAQRIADASGAQFDWEFNLIQSDEANAFVLPGGKVVVYTGILPICEDEASLAFVIGHEVGHAVARHGAERVTQSLLIQGGLKAAELSLGDSRQKATIMGALGMGAQFGVALPFSRAQESDADHTGIIYMARAGYDPSVAPLFWKKMARRGGQQPPEFASTHPSHSTRTQQLEEWLPAARAIYEKAPTKYGLGERLF